MGVATIVEGRPTFQSKRHGPTNSLNASHDAMLRAIGGIFPDRHEINDATHPIGRMETGDQHIGVWPIILFAFHMVGDGGNGKPSSLAIIQNGGKHTRRIKVRKAQPIDGTVHSHQRRGAHVSDEAVIFNRLIRHGSLFGYLAGNIK